MKTTRIAFAILLVGVFSASAQAQEEPLVLYDNFNSSVIDSNKWLGREFETPGTNVLEIVREIDRGSLLISSRSYASTTQNNTGRGLTATSLRISEPENVTTIEAIIQVNDVETVDCDGNTFHTYTRATVMGVFFNAGSTSPAFGDATNDVTAIIGPERGSPTSRSDRTMNISARVYKCLDPQCVYGTVLASQNLGIIRVGQKRKLRLAWDKANSQFIFASTPVGGNWLTSGQSAVISYEGELTDTYPPGFAHKRLEIVQMIPNCTEETAPVAYMDVYFDNVYVNESALP